MTGRAYAQSAKIAAAIGPYEHYEDNREAHNNVMRMHRDATYAIPDSTVVDEPLLEAARRSWDDAVAARRAPTATATRRRRCSRRPGRSRS